MKKIITIALTALFLTTTANALGNNNSWSTPWNQSHYVNVDGQYVSDNGVFAFNSYDFWDPRWYSTEFTNMVNEIDDEFKNDNNYRSYKNFPAATPTIAK